jgi:hypothetical protein
MIAPINVNTELGRIVEAVDKIFQRRGERQREQWEDLQDVVEAIGLIVDQYSDLYVTLLIEIQWTMADPDAPEDDRRQLARLAQEFLTDDRLINKLAELRGSLQVASTDRKIASSRHRPLATQMRGLERSTTSYMNHLLAMKAGTQQFDSGGVRLWNLWDALLWLQGDVREIPIRDLTEEAIRNRRSDLTLAIHALVGQVHRQVGDDFMR